MLEVNQSRSKTQHAVITHANTFKGMKIPTHLWKKLGMMLHLSSFPLNRRELKVLFFIREQR